MLQQTLQHVLWRFDAISCQNQTGMEEQKGLLWIGSGRKEGLKERKEREGGREREEGRGRVEDRREEGERGNVCAGTNFVHK